MDSGNRGYEKSDFDARKRYERAVKRSPAEDDHRNFKKTKKVYALQ